MLDSNDSYYFCLRKIYIIKKQHTDDITITGVLRVQAFDLLRLIWYVEVKILIQLHI